MFPGSGQAESLATAERKWNSIMPTGIASKQALRGTVHGVCEHALALSSVARAIASAIAQPDDVDINTIVILPTAQAF